MSALDVTSGSLWRATTSLAWPAVLQALLINCYAFNDFYFVGLTQDSAATSALSSCFALVIIANMFISVFPVGAMTMMAQRFGAKARGEVEVLARQGIVATGVWAVGLTALSLLALPQIVAAMNAPAFVNVHISAYMGVIFGGLLMFASMRIASAIFYACGDTRTPLVLELISLIINTALNAALVPKIGITGAAIATVASRAVPGLLGLALIARGRLGISVFERGARGWRPDPSLLRRMATIGTFESLSGALYGIIFLMLNRMAGTLGPAAQGGLGAGLRGIEWLGFAFGDGFLVASVAIVGQNIGAGQRHRALKGAWLNAIMSALCCQAVGMLFLFFPVQLSAIITSDAQTLAYAAQYVGTVGWIMWAVGLEMSMYGAILGTGATHMTLLISGALNIARVPIAAYLLFGPSQILTGTLWAAFGHGAAPALLGTFDALCLTIALTATLKAILYALYFSWASWRARQER